MSPPTPKKTESKQIKLIAKDPRKLKAAIQAWVVSAEKTDCDPLRLKVAPAWAENALAEAVKITLPGKRLPTKGECDAEFIGELAGRQRAFAKLFSGEIPLSPQMQADIGKIEKQAASLPPTPERKARAKLVAKDFLNMVDANDQAIPQLMAAALASSHEDAVKFQRGLLRGMSLAAEELDAGKIKQRHTQTFWVLGLRWRKYYRCRSVAEVHRKLCAEFGEKKIGSLKTFESRVAKKIGMKFGRAGRPSKSK